MPDIKKTLNELEPRIDDLSKSIRGYGLTIDELLNPYIEPVNFDKFNANNIKTTHTDLFNLRGKDKGSQYQINERIYSSVDSLSKGDYTEFVTMLQDRHMKNLEMNSLLNEIPELQTTLSALASDVIYPNNLATSGINIDIVGVDQSSDLEKYNRLIKFFKPLDDPLNVMHNRKKYNYDIAEDIEQIIRDFGIYGYRIVATIPYKVIARDLLYDKENPENQTFTGAGEAVNYISNKYKEVNKGYSEALLIDSLESLNVVSKNINDNIRHIVSNTPYSESDVDLVSSIIEEAEEDLFTSYNVNKSHISSDLADLLKPVGENNLNTLELANVEKQKAKNNKKFVIDKLVGCTHDVLDPSKTIPIFIKDELLGVYLIENDISSVNVINSRSLSNLIKAPTILESSSNITSAQKMKDIIFSDIRKVLTNNLDKKLLKNNPMLIEDIQFIIENESMRQNNYAPKIRFIPKEYLTMHKIGPGPLGTPLIEDVKSYCRAYVYLLKSTLINEIYLNKPRLKINVKYNGDPQSSSQIYRMLESIRRSQPTIRDMGIPDVVNSSSASYHTMVITSNLNGDEPFTVEQLPGAEIKDNEELRKSLRNAITTHLGYPADALDPNTNIDFAKKIANINQQTLERVRKIQNTLSLSLSDFCTKRAKFMTGDPNIEVKVTFELPGGLIDENKKEVFDNRTALGDIYESIIDGDQTIDDELKDAMKQNIRLELVSDVIDLDLYNRVKLDVATKRDIGKKL